MLKTGKKTPDEPKRSKVTRSDRESAMFCVYDRVNEFHGEENRLN